MMLICLVASGRSVSVVGFGPEAAVDGDLSGVRAGAVSVFQCLGECLVLDGDARGGGGREDGAVPSRRGVRRHFREFGDVAENALRPFPERARIGANSDTSRSPIGLPATRLWIWASTFALRSVSVSSRSAAVRILSARRLVFALLERRGLLACSRASAASLRASRAEAARSFPAWRSAPSSSRPRGSGPSRSPSRPPTLRRAARRPGRASARRRWPARRRSGSTHPPRPPSSRPSRPVPGTASPARPSRSRAATSASGPTAARAHSPNATRLRLPVQRAPIGGNSRSPLSNTSIAARSSGSSRSL